MTIRWPKQDLQNDTNNAYIRMNGEKHLLKPYL